MMKKRYPPLELTPSQSEILCAIFDTFLAKLNPSQEQALVTRIQGKEHLYDITQSQVRSLANISASSIDIHARVLDYFQDAVEPSKRGDLLRVLDIMTTRPGSLFMTGYLDSFHQLDQQNREQVLLSWKHSSIRSFSQLFSTLSGLCLSHAYNRTYSPLLKSIGFKEDKSFENHPEYETVQHDRIPMMTKEEITGMAFNVIVVGSGAGGGVVASELASAGYSVLVIERGKYYHPSEMVQEENQGFKNMYDGGTTTTSTDGNMQCLTASTFGGGTALNYSVSLMPQHFVREEWAKLGLPHFISPQFQQDLDRVCDRIGATKDNVMKTKAAELFANGCKKLGYDFESVPLNSSGRAHHCNTCMLGCKTGVKNGTANTWLVDALNHDAKFLDQTTVKRVITSEGKAIGVECYVHNSSEVTRIMAERVVVSCGALYTPTLLKNSGLTNVHIGKHLAFQPLSLSFGFFDELIRQNEGPLITSVCNASDNWHGDNYGAKIEDVWFLPGGTAANVPWLGAASHKDLMMRHKNMMTMVNVGRDKDSVGMVDHDPSSPNALYSFKISKHDTRSLTECMEKSLKIMVTSGAREVYTNQYKLEPFKFREDEESRVDNGRFMEWLKTVHTAGTSNTPLLSAHQLGSCRMGVTAQSSAVQASGETWEVKNLHVADGSVFPTAVGVNPMVTIEAVALHVARNVIHSLNPRSRL